MGSSLGGAAERRGGVALLCLDLDGFKQINDLFGHAAGDEVLVEVADRLRRLLGDRCIAARLGGDEFAILATGLSSHRTPDGAAQSIIRALSSPFARSVPRSRSGAASGSPSSPGTARHTPSCCRRPTWPSGAPSATASVRTASSRERWIPRCGTAISWPTICGSRSEPISFSSTTNRSSRYPPIGCPASKPCCAGTTRCADPSRRASSYPSPRRRGSSCRWERGCCARPAGRRPDGRGPSASPSTSRSRSSVRRACRTSSEPSSRRQDCHPGASSSKSPKVCFWKTRRGLAISCRNSRISACGYRSTISVPVTVRC